MNRLSIYVCENFAPEYQSALETQGLTDAIIKKYPCLCEKKWLKTKASDIFKDDSDGAGGLLICSKNCDALKLLPDRKEFKTITGQYCFSHFSCDEFLELLISQGSYIITSEWLKNWEEHISSMGFIESTAKQFFQETSKQIVLLDSGMYTDSQVLLMKFSSYVGLPYLIVSTDLEGIKLMLKSSVFEWRLNNKSDECSNTINELRIQCAEYSAVFDLMGKISSHSDKRDIVGKIKELFTMMFGAQDFNFWGADSNIKPNEIQTLIGDYNNSYKLFKDNNRFLIKIEWDETIYGVLDAGGFLFPQYIEKYLNLAIEISKYCGLALHNNEQYERILASEQQMTYLSFHDSLTGLYNRAYINQISSDSRANKNVVVFMFDIDKLKYVNDNFGHAEGDKLIHNFAGIIKACFRETDIVARIGGDEFTAIMYDADEDLAKKMKNRIVNNIKLLNNNLETLHLRINVSMGFSVLKDSNDTLESAMKKADQIMYAEKKSKTEQGTK